MEEILASIKRIIAEDGEGQPAGRRQRGPKPNAPGPQAAEPEDEVLELTHRIDAPQPDADAIELPPEVPSPPEPVAEHVTAEAVPPEAVQQDETEAPQPEPSMPQSPAEPLPAADPAEPAEETLLSPATRQASRQAIAALSAMVVRADPPGADTLEGLVRDMLKPMLKEWLDARLPDLVEQVVAREIAKIVEQRG